MSLSALALVPELDFARILARPRGYARSGEFVSGERADVGDDERKHLVLHLNVKGPDHLDVGYDGIDVASPYVDFLLDGGRSLRLLQNDGLVATHSHT